MKIKYNHNKKFLAILCSFLITFSPIGASVTSNNFIKTNLLTADNYIKNIYDAFNETFVGSTVLRHTNQILSTMLMLYVLEKIMGFKTKSFISHDIEPAVVTDTTLKDYAGTVPNAVLVLVDQIKNREAYKKVNAPFTKGVLLTGAPGTGKSFLARAIAGELQCPFYATSATEFAQPYVGASEIMIRDLFDRARKAAMNHPSKLAILFIDEIDAIGKRNVTYDRGAPIGTLQTFLTEMDGFNKVIKDDRPWYKKIIDYKNWFSKNKDQAIDIVILAATNTPDALDSALKRKGRFDHTIEIKNPDKAGRKAIITLYLARYPHDSNIDSEKLAILTEGMSPADINALFGEAARDAGSKKQTIVGIHNFCHALFEGKQSQDKGKGSFSFQEQILEGFKNLKESDINLTKDRTVPRLHNDLGIANDKDRQVLLNILLTMYPCDENLRLEDIVNSSLIDKTEQELLTIFENAYQKSKSQNRKIQLNDLVLIKPISKL